MELLALGLVPDLEVAPQSKGRFRRGVDLPRGAFRLRYQRFDGVDFLLELRVVVVSVAARQFQRIRLGHGLAFY